MLSLIIAKSTMRILFYPPQMIVICILNCWTFCNQSWYFGAWSVLDRMILNYGSRRLGSQCVHWSWILKECLSIPHLLNRWNLCNQTWYAATSWLNSAMCKNWVTVFMVKFAVMVWILTSCQTDIPLANDTALRCHGSLGVKKKISIAAMAHGDNSIIKKYYFHMYKL